MTRIRPEVKAEGMGDFSGWRNRATWLVHLHTRQDPAVFREWREATREEIAHAEDLGGAVEALSARLKRAFGAKARWGTLSAFTLGSLSTQSELECVDWEEVAREWVVSEGSPG